MNNGAATDRRCRLIYIGNFVSRHTGVQPYCELLSARLEGVGWAVERASSERSRVRRWLSMLRHASRARPGVPVLVDVFSTAGFLWAESCGRLAAARGAPVVLILRGGALLDRTRTSFRRVRALFANASRIVTPSRFLQKNLGAFSPRGISYLPNAIDISHYRFVERANLSPRLIWLRALAEDYLPEVAVNAVAELKARFPGTTLQLAGPDKDDGTGTRVRGLVGQLGLEDNVRVTGSVSKNEVPDFLQRGDIFLNTTRYESFGVSVLEAAACGLCIVTSDAGELPYLWNDGEDALLVPTGDVTSMVIAVQRLLEEPGLAVRISRGGRRKAEAHDWTNVLPRWQRLLTELVDDA